MRPLPRHLSIVAVALGAYDVIRAVAHTVFVGYAASEIAGLDLSGPTGRDQVVLMSAFGASNVITAVALIMMGLTSRLGSLVLLTTIPIAYGIASAGLAYWGADLVGQGVFPGAENMKIYVAICVLAVAAALIQSLRPARPASGAA